MFFEYIVGELKSEYPTWKMALFHWHLDQASSFEEGALVYTSIEPYLGLKACLGVGVLTISIPERPGLKPSLHQHMDSTCADPIPYSICVDCAGVHALHTSITSQHVNTGRVDPI